MTKFVNYNVHTNKIVEILKIYLSFIQNMQICIFLNPNKSK